MGYTEFIVVLCFVVTIWSNTANAEVDCRKFVFAPSCRGVSAKRSGSAKSLWPQIRNRYNDGLKEEDMSEEQQPVSTDDGEESIPTKIEIRTHRKRFSDLLKTSLLRRARSKSLTGLQDLLIPYESMNEIFGSDDD